jgi:poly(beta-D-mannuronate) lyase
MFSVFFLLSQKAMAKVIEINDVQQFNVLLDLVKPGDIIVWKDGVYSNQKIKFLPRNNGTENAPIIFKAQTPGKVIFSGNSQILIGGAYLQVEGFLFKGDCTLENEQHVIDFRSSGKQYASHSRVTNCAIIQYTRTEESGINNYFVNLVGDNNEVDHCYFEGKLNKGPTLVVEYRQEAGYVPGSDVAPSAHHWIHHNYFGYRTYSSNGGEQMRIGTSTTSFTHGYNIIEYNYFEDERVEAEVISNKSWDNIYRFNSFIGNDGGMVIRHGQKCFVYGNYINGKSGRNLSAGLRVINPDNTIFNNYVENTEGGDKSLKAAIDIMAGLDGSALNEYYPADNAIVAYNTLVNVVGPAIKLGIGNSSKGKPFIAPKNVLVAGNSIINTSGRNTNPIFIANEAATYSLLSNQYTNGSTNEAGFELVNINKYKKNGTFYTAHPKIDQQVLDQINERLSVHQIKLSVKEITQFDPTWIVSKAKVGVSWIEHK